MNDNARKTGAAVEAPLPVPDVAGAGDREIPAHRSATNHRLGRQRARLTAEPES
jgi:hypothetical protein